MSQYVVPAVCLWCHSFNNENGFCLKCHNSINTYISETKNSILNEYCKHGYYDLFVTYFNTTTFTQSQLLSALTVAFSGFNYYVVAAILFSPKFFPDNVGYDFFYYLPQNIISTFFYKRFLIKYYIKSQYFELDDIIPRIIDPNLKLTTKPWHCMKFLIHNVLFPHKFYINDKICSNTWIESQTGITFTINRQYYPNDGFYDIFHNYLIKVNSDKDFYFVAKIIDNIMYELDETDIKSIAGFSAGDSKCYLIF